METRGAESQRESSHQEETVHRTLQGVIGIAAVGLLSLTGCAHHGAHAHGGRVAEGMGLTVIGTGEAKAQPDLARASMGIEIRAETAEQATAQANERMAAVLAALKAAGVVESDLRTHDFSVSFERDFTPQPVVVPAPAEKPEKGTRGAPQTVQVPVPSVPRGSYRVANTVEVIVRDMSKVSQVLTAATSAGANNVWGISFELSDREPLRARARAQAIERAKQSAAQLAELTGVKLGRIVAVDDQLAGDSPRVYASALRAEAADASQVPVQGGEVTINHQVRLVYALADR